MAENLLEVRNLTVNVEDKEILHKLDLDIQPGETHVLMGPNGAGKSTLGYALMGNPKYTITDGSIQFAGEDITKLPVDKRAKAGLFLSFQNPLEVPGISLSSFLKTALEQQRGVRIKAWDFRKELRQAMALLQMDNKYAERDLNMGFSGGEKKKAEILQLLMLNPKLAILDETDSGLDVDAVKIVSQGIKTFQEHRQGALLIITHNTKILDALHVDKTHVLVHGQIIKNAGPELVDEVSKNGFEQFIQNKE
ncbi:Fe-S cluster assembly ATPase SufC [uncultured Phascolarctobacterium sp.]|jgi:Fe-S cluster assembly ATP-binding protein|uniref:Fe-S cluster assembly ATPase SufC n=1 Tax=uncultured Phascolarctobacterium sp. TaxID=512296 RepID=UPI0025E97038|nr:Fe-S cluster assembly ATPase SufC [uncultured Phascolarctobacterium sp.]